MCHFVHRFSELLLEFSSCEDNSEVLLESLDPLIEKDTFSPDNYLKQPVGGKAASQLCMWVQGVHRLHAKLQATMRPLQSRVTAMKASLAEYSDKLYHQENKVNHANYYTVYSVVFKTTLHKPKGRSGRDRRREVGGRGKGGRNMPLNMISCNVCYLLLHHNRSQC